MKWHLSCEESLLLNLYKRQGAVFMAQASSYVTITADSYRLTQTERAFPKGDYITVKLHTTLGTILVHNAEWYPSQSSIALGTESLRGSQQARQRAQAEGPGLW